MGGDSDIISASVNVPTVYGQPVAKIPAVAADWALLNDICDIETEEDSLHDEKETEMVKAAAPTEMFLNRHVVVITLLICMTATLLGYDIGVIAGAILLIKAHFQLSDIQTEVSVGILNVTATLGVFVAGRVADRHGRRWSLIYTSMMFILGSALMSCAWSFTPFLLGRLVTGFAVGGGIFITPLFICELAPAHFRGALISATEVAICVGVLCGYVVNLVMYHAVDQNDALEVELSWRFMLAICIIPPLLILAAIRMIPESPRWLVSQGQELQALYVLDKLMGDSEEAQATLERIVEREKIAQQRSDATESNSKLKAFFQWSNLEPQVKVACVAGMGVAFLSQATGIEGVTYYSNIILLEAGFSSRSQALAGTAVMGLFKVMAVLIFTFTADSFGRRPLLISSFSGMSISMLLFGVGHFTSAPQAFMLLTFTSFVCAFSLGLGPITYLVPAELFPQPWRATGVSMCLFIARFTSAVVAMTYLSVANLVTPGGLHLVFAAVAAIGVVFSCYYLPETKTLTLEEITF